MKRLGLGLALVMALQSVCGAESAQQRFESADAAVNALISAIRTVDRKALVEILGPEGRPLVRSGDEVADLAEARRFLAEFDQSHRLEGSGGRLTLYVGRDDFPFAIPLVPDGPSWRWDTAAGSAEILNRRVGRNELDAIQVCLAYVDAQREYYSEDHTGTGIREYAQRLGSTKGKHDGLHWQAQPGQAQSPLGPLVAQARAEGYSTPRGSASAPYHGYLYRLLFAQGPDAPGGAYDFVVRGHMIGGFALVAIPAQYGVSGVMTFIVSHDGVVYEKDLGVNTAQAAGAIKAFSPDRTWRKVESTASVR